MKNLELILDDVGMGEIRRNSLENKILHDAKVRIMAYKGCFDGLATPREIHLAKIKGVIPKGFEIHHIIPLCCKNTSIALDNMVIMDSSSHRFLHRHIYDRQLSRCIRGGMACVFVPDFDLWRIARYETFDETFLRYIKQRQRE